MAKRPPKIEDAHLWDEVKKTIIPLADDVRGPVKAPDVPNLDHVNVRHETRGQGPHHIHQRPRAQTGMSRKDVRKITTGQTQIDSVIDLHGLTRQQAQNMLEDRMPEAHAKGFKCVLLITGKGGKRFAQTHDLPAAQRTREDFAMDGGVLRSFVPELLSSPPISHYVASYRTSVQKHGGEGAYYVMLRTRGPQS